MTEQQTLFDWFRARTSPRGAVSRNGLDDAEVSDAEVRALHRRLESALGTVDLVITNNRKRMVTARKKGRRHELRVHHMFVDADDHAVSALIGLARGEAVSALIGLARGEAKSRDQLREFIRENRDAISHAPSPSALRTDGTHHDLQGALERAVDLVEANDLDDVQITWGRYGRGSRSIRFGSYDFQQRLIRIHPALDETWVPAFFVEFVVYHELLHGILPVERDSAGRRILHSKEFRRLEQRFPEYEEAIAWERVNLKRLLNR